jgi:predicted AAA+ superfamily ATPase
LQWGSEASGKAFENWLYHELSSYILYREKNDLLSYWRLADSGREVDFVVNDCEIVIEAKASEKIGSTHLKGLREFKKEHPSVKQCLLVSLEQRQRLTDDNILILPYQDFLKALWQGDVF